MKRVEISRMGQKLSSFVRHWPEWLILTHTRAVGVGLMAVGLLLAVGLLWQTFFWEARVLPVVPEVELRLSLELIDQLELWIEEVEDERRAGIDLPVRPLFVIDDPAAAEE